MRLKSQRMVQAEDLAERVHAMLQLPPRVFVRNVVLITTNPV